MTNTESLKTLLRADLAADIDATNSTSELALFRITHIAMRAATRELSNALTADFYFSDSQYDEITNPANCISEFSPMIDAIYERSLDQFDASIDLYLDSIDYLLSYALTDPDDESESPTTLPALESALLELLDS